MIRFFLVFVLTVMSAGCATTPLSSSLCTTLGCIEPDAGSEAPIGAGLEFSQCNSRNSAMDTYKYVRVESGWNLVFYETALSAKCGTGNGA